MGPSSDHVSPQDHSSLAVWKRQAAIATTQAAFVVGSVYLKATISRLEADTPNAFRPVLFAFFREAVAAPILLFLAWIKGGRMK